MLIKKNLEVKLNSFNFAPQNKRNELYKCEKGPFVYRLGREIFIL